MVTSSHLWPVAAPHNQVFTICNLPCWLPQSIGKLTGKIASHYNKSLIFASSSNPLIPLHPSLTFTMYPFGPIQTLAVHPAHPHTPFLTLVTPPLTLCHLIAPSYLPLACLQTYWNLQLPANFSTDLDVERQQEVVSLTDYGIWLTMTRGTVGTAVSKWGSCALQLYHLVK